MATMIKENEKQLNIGVKIKPNTILFFDMDGTIVDTDYANYLSYKKAIKSVLQTDSVIEYNRKERFNRVSLKKTLPNLTDKEFEKIIKLKEKNYKEQLSQTKLNKLVSKILLHYSNTNKTVLVTNCHEDRAILTLNYYKLTDKFSNLFFKQFGNNNEKTNKFHNAIQCLGISPKLVIVFENEENAIKDALNAGILIENILFL